MILPLSTLKSNLVEIDAWARSQAVSSQKDSPFDLFSDFVPNCYGTRLYNTGFLIGGVLKFYWRVQAWFNGKDLMPEVRNQAVKKSIEAFKHFQATAVNNDKLFINTLLNTPGANKCDGKDLIKLRKRIQKYLYSTHGFWNLRNCNLSKSTSKTLSVFFDAVPFNPGLLSENLLQLEGLTGLQIPLEIINKLSKEQKLTDLEEVKLNVYLAKLRKPTGLFSGFDPKAPKYLVKVRFFHRLLVDIIEKMHRPRDSHSVNTKVAQLEKSLSDRQFTLFEQPDPQHIEWRNQLEGKKVTFDGKKIAVGKRIDQKKEGFDRNIVYSLTDMESHVLRIGPNEASLGIEEIEIQQTQYGFRYTPSLPHKDPKNRFVIVERLFRSISQISEHFRDNGGILNIIYPVRDLLECLVKLPFTPTPLSAQKIGFNSQGRLLSCHHLKKAPYNPTSLETFTFDCGLKDQNFYVELMKGSQLHMSSQVKFYETVLKHTLNGSSKAVLWASLTNFEFDSALRDQGKKFSAAILHTKMECESYLKDNFQILDQDEFSKVLNYAITVYHREQCIGSFLKETMIEDVCKKVVELLRLTPY